MIDPISVDVKRAGGRSAGKRPAAFDEAEAGNVPFMTVQRIWRKHDIRLIDSSITSEPPFAGEGNLRGTKDH